MDVSFTYSTQDRVCMTIYVPPGYDPPDTLTLKTESDKPVELFRLSDMSLKCEPVGFRIGARGEEIKVTGECKSADCHSLTLGECKCGRHPSPVRYERAT